MELQGMNPNVSRGNSANNLKKKALQSSLITPDTRLSSMPARIPFNLRLLHSAVFEHKVIPCIEAKRLPGPQLQNGIL